jgi:hypothetical protein
MRQSIIDAGAYEGEANQLLREFSGLVEYPWLNMRFTHCIPVILVTVTVQAMSKKLLQRGSLREMLVEEQEQGRGEEEEEEEEDRGWIQHEAEQEKERRGWRQQGQIGKE